MPDKTKISPRLRLKFTPLEFETPLGFTRAGQASIKLKFTPLEFETLKFQR